MKTVYAISKVFTHSNLNGEGFSGTGLLLLPVCLELRSRQTGKGPVLVQIIEAVFSTKQHILFFSSNRNRVPAKAETEFLCLAQYGGNGIRTHGTKKLYVSG